MSRARCAKRNLRGSARVVARSSGHWPLIQQRGVGCSPGGQDRARRRSCLWRRKAAAAIAGATSEATKKGGPEFQGVAANHPTSQKGGGGSFGAWGMSCRRLARRFGL